MSDGPPRLYRPPAEALVDHPRAAYLIGDSLTVDTLLWGGLRALVRGHGVRLAGWDARAGERIRDGLDRLRRVRHRLPPTVLVALGSNDIVWRADRDRLRRDVDALLATLRGHRVVWVDVSVTGDSDLAARQRVLNTLLAERAEDGQLRLLRWSSMVRQRPGLLLPIDPFRLHVTAEGAAWRAVLYASGLRAEIHPLPATPSPGRPGLP